MVRYSVVECPVVRVSDDVRCTYVLLCLHYVYIMSTLCPVMSNYVRLCPAVSNYVRLCPVMSGDVSLPSLSGTTFWG